MALKWFIGTRHQYQVGGDITVETFWRAHNHEDAVVQCERGRPKGEAHTHIYPLEEDGTYWNGNQFMRPERLPSYRKPELKP